MSKPTVYVVRHAKTKFNPGAKSGSEERIRAWMDVPLDEQGLAETDDIAKQMSSTGVKHIVSSDLSRAIVTGQKISKATGAQLHPTDQLRPWNLGKLTGEKLEDILPQLEYYSKNPTEKVPGGESYNDFYSRYRGVLHNALQYAQENPQEPIALVAHTRHLLALDSLLNGGLAGAADTASVPMKGGQVPGTVLKLESDGKKFNKSTFYEPSYGTAGRVGS